MNIESYRQASDLEETDPGKALEIYNKIEHENLDFRQNILLLGIIGFSIGFIIAFFVGQSIVSHKYIAPLAIWYGIGISTTFGLHFAATIKMEPLTKLEAKKQKYQFLFIPVMAIFVPVAQGIELACLLVITILFAGVIFGILSFIYHIVSEAAFISPLSLIDMPIYVYFPVFLISFVIVFIILFVFDVIIPSKISVKLILRVIKLKMSEVLSMLILFSSVILIILGEYPFNVFDNFIVGLVMSVIIGTALGFALAYIERDYRLGNLYRIAKARCLIRMDRDFETNFLLKDVILIHKPFTSTDLASTDQSIKDLAVAVSLIQERRELKKRRTLFMLFPGGIWIRPHRISEKDIMGAIDIVRTSICDNEYREILSDNIQRTEKLAAKAIEEIKDKRAVEPLIQALNDEHWKVRSNAACDLGEVKDKRAVEPLIQALKDESWDIRMNAVWALGEIKDKRAVEPLQVLKMEVLEARKEEVRKEIALALEKIGEPAVGSLIRVLKGEDAVAGRDAAWTLGKIGEPAVGPLIPVLKHEDWGVRKGAVWILGEIGEPAVEPLIQALKDKDERIRMNAAWALGEIKDERAVEPLIQALKNDDEHVRMNAAWALGEIKDKRAVEPLIHALKNEYWDVRINAAVALGEIKDKRAVEPIQALKKEVWEAQEVEVVALALKKIGESAVDPSHSGLG